MQNINFFYADYRDGRVHIGGKVYPAGIFAEVLMNKYYENDTAARIVVFRSANIKVTEQLKIGYLIKRPFMKCRDEILTTLNVVKHLPPFSLLDIQAEKEKIEKLFSESNAEKISDYFHKRGKVALTNSDELMLGYMPKEYNKEYFAECERLIQDIKNTLEFYNSLANDLMSTHRKINEFIDKYGSVERFDEAHLLLIALEVFGNDIFPVKTEYIAVTKTKNSKNAVTARRLYFSSYYSFIVTDFFEGLHYGHYVRICPICERYFLMQSARRQKYCSGMAPELLKGKPISCRKLAARQNRRELASDDPVKDIYSRRVSVLRTEKHRGTITEEFEKTAKSLAKEHMQRAMQDQEYAKKQYAIDMARHHLYTETDRLLKQQ